VNISLESTARGLDVQKGFATVLLIPKVVRRNRVVLRFPLKVTNSRFCLQALKVGVNKFLAQLAKLFHSTKGFGWLDFGQMVPGSSWYTF